MVSAVTAEVIRHCHYTAIGPYVGADARAAQWLMLGCTVFKTTRWRFYAFLSGFIRIL